MATLVSATQIPEVTVTRVITRTRYTSTTLVDVTVSCTRNIYATPALIPAASAANATAAAPPSSSAAAGTPSSSASVHAKRQTSATSATSSAPVSATSTPASSAVPTAAPEPPTPRTRTVYSVTTITPTTPAERTRYPCASTLAWAFTVDTTTTISYPYTLWDTTTTSTTSITCAGYGGEHPFIPLPSSPDP